MRLHHRFLPRYHLCLFDAPLHMPAIVYET